MLQFIQSHAGNLIAAAVVVLLLGAVNFGPAILAWIRAPKASGWKGSQPAPPSFAPYLAAVEASCAGMQPADILVVLRGGLCPDAASVVKVVKQG